MTSNESIGGKIKFPILQWLAITLLVLQVTIIVRNLFWPNKLSFLRSSRMILVYVLHPFATNFKLQLCSLDNVDFVGAWVALAFVQALATTQVSIYPIK